MVLHHTREIADMRSEYDVASTNEPQAQLDSAREPIRSHRSQAIEAPPIYDRSTEPSWARSPSTKQMIHSTLEQPNPPSTHRYFDDRPTAESPQTSVVSTVASEVEADDDDGEPVDYDLLPDIPNPARSTAMPTTPSDFSKLFPSDRKLSIHHDDTTLDGNMNLRIDTAVAERSHTRDMTLFHLRMHELRTRVFSLRRYCRDSGREVCHSSLKHAKHASEKRPSLQRSLSNALSSMISRSESRSPTTSSLKRFDSGYGSMHSVEVSEERRPKSAGQESSSAPALIPNMVRLEFSNYAQVDVRRTGSKGSKRYDFEYWGMSYSWRRKLDHHHHSEVSFILTRSGNEHVLGQIRPTLLTAAEVESERLLGGWIRPSTMWIEDDDILHAQKDLADVIVAAGLIALVDDSIRVRFPRERARPSRASLFHSSSSFDHSRPRGFWGDLLSRRDSTSDTDRGEQAGSRPSSGGRPYSSGTGVSGF